MEPVKFEEHIKSQLQKREIKPSEGSWEKLQERLQHKERPSGPQFWWIGVAAAIAGIFFVLGTLFNNPVLEDAPVIVEKPAEEIAPGEKIETPTKIPKEEVLAASEKAEKEEELKIEKVPQKVRPERKVLAAIIPENKVQEKIPSGVKNLVVEITSDRTVDESFQNPSEVSDAEIEALLLAANAEIENDPAYAVRTVDADDLLEEVEYELDQSFRQKVFEILKEGFSKAKTAVAQRNY